MYIHEKLLEAGSVRIIHRDVLGLGSDRKALGAKGSRRESHQDAQQDYSEDDRFFLRICAICFPPSGIWFLK